ncbi:MAG: hypothetical protein ACPGQL_11005, partial [Thermoplasmatota archaeon]
DVAGTVTATAFVGDGSGLTNLPAGGGNTFDQDLIIGNADAADDDTIFFDQSGQSLHWDNTADWFEFSNDLALNSDLYMEATAASADQNIYFSDGMSNTGARLLYDQSEARFAFSHQLATARELRVGCDTESNSAYSIFAQCGAAAAHSGLMSEAADIYVAEDLEIGQVLGLSGELRMNANTNTGQDGDQNIYFYDGDSNTGEFLRWDESEDYFEFSNDLALNSDLYMEASGTDGDQSIFFAEGASATGESLKWDDSQEMFRLSDKLHAHENIVAGCTADHTLSFNSFGACSDAFTVSGDITNDNDVFILGDLEVDESAYLAGTLYMKGNSGSGADGDQTIYFYDAGARDNEYLRWDESSDKFELTNDLALGDNLFMSIAGTDVDQTVFFADGGSTVGEHLQWDDSDDRFEFTNDLAVAGALRGGCVTDSAAAYSMIGGCGATGPVGFGVDDPSDLFVAGNLEVAGNGYFSGAIYANGRSVGGGDGDQHLYFYEDDGPSNERLSWDDSDDKFELTDRVQVWDNLIAGCSGSTTVAYNAFGSCSDTAPASGDMGTDNDVYVNLDLEVGGDTYLSRSLYMEGDTGNGADSDQTIYFYDAGTRNNERFAWDDSEGEFYISDDVEIFGNLDLVGDLDVASGKIEHAAWEVVFNLGAGDDVVIGRAGESSNVDFYIMDGGICLSGDNTCGSVVDGDMQIAAGSICVDNDGTCGTPADGQISAVQYNTGNSDLAEVYPSSDLLLPGEVVALDPSNPGGFKRAEAGDRVLRVVSTDPGLVLGAPDADELWTAFGVGLDHDDVKPLLPSDYLPGTYPIALSGRVPTLVNLEGGAILPGDAITLSSVPGVAKKAADGEPVLGHALAAFDGVGGTVEVFVGDGDQAAQLAQENQELQSELATVQSELADLQARMAALEEALGL